MAELPQPTRHHGSLTDLYLSSLRSEQSRRSMAASLRQVTALLTADAGIDAEVLWHRLDYATALRLRQLMRDRWAPATINRHLAAVRGVVNVAFLTRLMDADQHGRVLKALASERPRHTAENPEDRLVSHVELLRIFDALAGDTSVIARRDAALVAILSMGGLRRSEVCDLDLSDWDTETGELLVRHGKGDKVRKVWLHGGATAALDAWLAFRGTTEGPLLLHVRRGGHIVAGEAGRITPHALWRRITQLATRAGVRQFSPHDLRRKMITDLLDFGDDLSAVQKLAGHSMVATTARYDRRGERAARKAATHLDVPYVPPRS